MRVDLPDKKVSRVFFERLDPRRTQIEFVFVRRRRSRQRTQAEALRDSLPDMLLLLGIRMLILVAPSPELALALLRHRVIVLRCS